MTPSAQPSPGESDQDVHTDDEEGWTLVTNKKTKKPKPQGQRWNKGESTVAATVGSLKETEKLLSQRMLGNLWSKSHAFLSPCTSTSQMTFSSHMVEVEMEEPSKGTAIATEGEKTLTLEEGLPTHFSIEKALRLPKKMRRALAAVLRSPDDHEVQESKNEILKLRPHECATCCAAKDSIHFTDEDLLLGSKPYNRHLFVSGYVREHKVNRMLVDGGSAINIMPMSIMTTIGIKVDELSLSRLLIQGFNQRRRRMMGMIRVEMTISELKSSTIFHVIDARTSYGLLLGRHSIHANGVVPSTLHQCLKFYRKGVKVIYGDTKPFIEAESHFTDAKFYMDEDMVLEALLKEIKSTGKATPKKQEW
ncbi:hypothetical protein EV2_019396 [Malus domestica]